MKIAFAGTPKFGALVLGALLRSHHEITLVFTQPDRPAGRGRKHRKSPVKLLAEEHGLRIEQPQNISTQEMVDLLVELGVGVLAVAAYGQILKQPFLGALPIINVHASLLPKYRGASPIERAIMAGEGETGVSIMDVIAELDAGDIYVQKPVRIEADDDAGRLYEKLGDAGGAALIEVLNAMEADGVTANRQSPEKVTYAEKIGKEDLEIDWNRDSWEVYNQIRALSPHIGAFTNVGGHRLKIWKARVAEGSNGPGSITAENGRIFISCGSGSLELLEVQPEGKRRMEVTEFLRGYKQLLKIEKLGG